MAKKRGLDFKALLLAHVEKLVCGIIAICFVMLVWFAVSRDGIPSNLEPEDISRKASEAQVTISRTTWAEFSNKPLLRNFSQESGWYTVPFENYELKTPFDPPNFLSQGLRSDPKYFPIQELEAHYDQGPLALLTKESLMSKFGRDGPPPKEVTEAIKGARDKPVKKRVVLEDPAGLVGGVAEPVKIKLPGEKVEDNEVSEGKRWIMVTALLPVEEQIKAYEEVFRNAAGFDQKNDLPLYFGYEVERADVTGGATPEWKPYDKVSSKSLLISMLRWQKNKRAEVIDKLYVHPIFTWPLPPRVLELWDEEDKHSRIPMARVSVRKQVGGELLGDPLAGLGEDKVEDLEELLAGSRPRVAEGTGDERVPMKMVRYFDFDVVPGHAYQYRFRAVLRDPNYIRETDQGETRIGRVELKLLEQIVVDRLNKKRKELEKAEYPADLIERLMQITYTDWSKPSPTVKVPPDKYLLAVEAKHPPVEKYNQEPSASLLVTLYDSALGVETGGHTTVGRGDLVDFTIPDLRVINLDYETFDTREQNFNPNVMLVDIQGGETEGETGLAPPAELLLLDLKSGKLIVNDEMEDSPNVKNYHARQSKLDSLIPSANPVGGPQTGPRGLEILE